MTDQPYPDQPDRHQLAALDQDSARARRLYSALAAGDQESIAVILRDVADSGRGASVLLAAVEMGIEFARSCESAGLLRDESGQLTLQGFLDSAAMNQITRAEATRRIAERDDDDSPE